MQEQEISIGGQIVFWNLGPTCRDSLKAGLESLGLGHHDVPIRTEVSSLGHAVRDYCTANYHNHRDFHVVNRRQPSKYGVDAFLMNRGQERPTSAASLFGVRVEDDTILITSRNGMHSPDRYDLQDRYDKYRREMPGTAVAKVVVEILKSDFRGTALRPSGGIYWVPKQYTPQYRDLAEVVEQCSLQADGNKMFRVNTKKDAECLRAVKAAIVAEVTTEVTALMTEVNDGELGKSALETRERAATDLFKKIEYYENDLGESLENLKDLAETVQQAIVLSALAI